MQSKISNFFHLIDSRFQSHSDNRDDLDTTTHGGISIGELDEFRPIFNLRYIFNGHNRDEFRNGGIPRGELYPF